MSMKKWPNVGDKQRRRSHAAEQKAHGTQHSASSKSSVIVEQVWLHPFQERSMVQSSNMGKDHLRQLYKLER